LLTLNVNLKLIFAKLHTRTRRTGCRRLRFACNFGAG